MNFDRFPKAPDPAPDRIGLFRKMIGLLFQVAPRGLNGHLWANHFWSLCNSCCLLGLFLPLILICLDLPQEDFVSKNPPSSWKRDVIKNK